MDIRRRLLLIACLPLLLEKPSPAQPSQTVIGPYVADEFYPADPRELAATVHRLLSNAHPPSAPGKLIGALVPHAGYPFSGSIAAQVYKAISLRPQARYLTVILLGTGHLHPIHGAATIAQGRLDTPLGPVPVNSSLAQRLTQISHLIETDPGAYAGEHSIEVELPFLQKILGRFSLVPLLMNTQDPNICQAVGKAVARIAKSPNILILVSSDLSHYPDRDTAGQVDRSTLKALPISLENPLYFWMSDALLLKRGGPKLVTVACGEAALQAALFAFKDLGANQVTPLAYVNSGMLAGADTNKTVGYAAVLWTRTKSPPPVEPALSSPERKRLLGLARRSIEDFLKNGPASGGPTETLWEDPVFNLPANVFVTLTKRDAAPGSGLRGCIGSLHLELPLAEAVEKYAVASATQDPRFKPVTSEELSRLKIDISRLSFYRPVSSPQAILPGRDGVLLIQGDKSGIFLPAVWREIPDKSDFLSELCSQKAGLPRECWKDPKTQMFTFTAEEFSEN